MNRPAADSSIEESQPDQLTLPVGRAEEEVGARLRQQRLKRRIAVADAARSLKLTATTLEEMERGELERHPPLYRRGYLRSYARFLGLDPEPLLAMVEVSDAPALRPVLPVARRGENFERFFKIATYTIVTTLIIPPLVWIYIQGGLSVMDRQAGLDEETGASVMLAQGDREADSLSRRAAPRQDLPAAEGTAGPVTASALPLAAIRPVRELASPEYSAIPEPDAPEASAELDPRSLLVIELLEDSWLEVYAADGQRLEYDLLRAGDQRRYTAEAPFRLLLGRASAVSLELDGVPVSFEGQERGDVLSLELTADGVVR